MASGASDYRAGQPLGLNSSRFENKSHCHKCPRSFAEGRTSVIPGGKRAEGRRSAAGDGARTSQRVAQVAELGGRQRGQA